jgi:hypothetical protein
MIQTVEAVIDKHGVVRLLQPVRVTTAHRALVTILDEAPAAGMDNAGQAAASASAEGWGVPCDDEALLLRETAAWEAASDEDALRMDERLAEMK